MNTNEWVSVERGLPELNRKVHGFRDNRIIKTLYLTTVERFSNPETNDWMWIKGDRGTNYIEFWRYAE